jgi:hypothetical protein
MNNFPFEANSNSKVNLNKKSMKQTAFEFGPNLLEVQTCLERSNKFPKILICVDLLECELRLA